ncbi:MAG: protein kinase, partial [Acidobacteria bacterium]|nr:protein kinase [Acidobacteriota bacterium]
MSIAPGTRLGSYEIVSPLGSGGMGEVYRARDTKLQREVAIKVLPGHLSKDTAALARFEREALAVASLSHPNILAIFDFGREGGLVYAVTELLEGSTLRDAMEKGPIPQRQAVDLAMQIGRGLAAAHDKGVIHRDLKPENLFVTRDGHVKILDFGLAKRVDPAPGSEDDTSMPTTSGRTEPGTVMGTMGYMSPEQVRGQAVEAPSDLFSFGAVLYELLSGKRAFRKDSAADTMAAILMLEPPPLSGTGREIPPALARIVERCLEKKVASRFGSAREVVRALENLSTATHSSPSPAFVSGGLRRIVIAIVVVVLLGTAALYALRRDAGPEAAPLETGPKRIAVLPFENLGEAKDDYFAAGIADEVRGKLTTLPGLEVIARGSSMPYKGTTKSPRAIARELGVRYLLTATVRWEREEGRSHVHVSAELVEVSGQGAPATRWQQPFEAELTGVFRVQADIASRVARALDVALSSLAEKRLLERPTQSLEAYDAFLRAEAVSSGLGVTDPPSLRRALALYEEAVALDPAFALAWARLSMACGRLYVNSTPTPALLARSREAADRALALAPNRFEGHLAYSSWVGAARRDPDEELEALAKAQRLAPANAQVLTAVALLEQSLGRWDANLEHLRQAERLDPRSVLTKRRLALAYLLLRRYPEARAAIDEGLAFAPTNLVLLELGILTSLAQGNLAEARAALKAVPEGVSPKALIAHLVQYDDVAWALEPEARKALLGLTAAAFDDDRGVFNLCLARAFALEGDAARVKV